MALKHSTGAPYAAGALESKWGRIGIFFEIRGKRTHKYNLMSSLHRNDP